jgi:N6-adenosine-specific RNA methylase IME4
MTGPYDLILADPPWLFASNSAARPGRNARRHYPCMPVADICALPVSRMAAPSALLLMWITAPLAHRGFEVLQAWGFRYVSQAVWVKDRVGLGHWARSRHELLYIAKRGDFPCPTPALFPDSVIVGQQREHSRKPDAVHRIVDARLGHLRRVELFARARRRGWDVALSNEAEKYEGQQA